MLYIDNFSEDRDSSESAVEIYIHNSMEFTSFLLIIDYMDGYLYRPVLVAKLKTNQY